MLLVAQPLDHIDTGAVDDAAPALIVVQQGSVVELLGANIPERLAQGVDPAVT